MTYRELKPRLAESKFRSRFKLTRDERAYIAAKGFAVLRAQAERIVRERLAPAFPPHDGRQTPMRGHAVFKAQHATGCCCRSCLEKWHGIPSGRALSEGEIADVTEVISEWLREQAGDLSEFPRTPELFD